MSILKKFFKKVKVALEKANLMPSFSEDTAFLVLVSIGIIYLLNDLARQHFQFIIERPGRLQAIILLGVVFTIYTSFFVHFKTQFQKHYIFWFILVSNVLGSFFLIFEHPDIIHNSKIWFIFPALNFLIFFSMIIFWYLDLADTDALPNKAVSYKAMIYGTLFVIVIAYISNDHFHNPWPITLSLAIAYASLFNKVFMEWLPNLFPNKEQKINKIENIIEQIVNNFVSNQVSFSESIYIDDSGKINKTATSGESNSDVNGILNSHSLVGVGSIGQFVSKKFWWSRENHDFAITVDIYEKGKKLPHSFAQLIELSSGKISPKRSVIYLGKNKINI